MGVIVLIVLVAENVIGLNTVVVGELVDGSSRVILDGPLAVNQMDSSLFSRLLGLLLGVGTRNSLRLLLVGVNLAMLLVVVAYSVNHTSLAASAITRKGRLLAIGIVQTVIWSVLGASRPTP